MKTKVENNKITIPEVGQAWKFRSHEEVWMRIDDLQGDVLQELRSTDYFCSVCLTRGIVVETSKTCNGIILLEPVGGGIVFTEV